MKSLFVLVLLCVSCAGSAAEVKAIRPEAPPCPAVVKGTCSDQLTLLDEEALKKGTSCPETSRLVFPSYYGQGKVLVLCQCK
jgi:hypothetical protein